MAGRAEKNRKNPDRNSQRYDHAEYRHYLVYSYNTYFEIIAGGVSFRKTRVIPPEMR